ncbi:hypothetical protein P9112_008979 [Eukaryota sp. TZLM1-RC]
MQFKPVTYEPLSASLPDTSPTHPHPEPQFSAPTEVSPAQTSTATSVPSLEQLSVTPSPAEPIPETITSKPAVSAKERALCLPSLITPHNKTREESTLFRAGQDSSVPSVYANRTLIDVGDATPNYLQATSTMFPASRELAAQSSFPYSLVWTPHPHLSDYDKIPPNVHGIPPRCRRCRAYLSPQAGKQLSSWVCRICSSENPLATNNFNDKELCDTAMKYGVVDYHPLESDTDFSSYQAIKGLTLASGEACTFCESIMYVLDCSNDSIKKGIFESACQALIDTLNILNEVKEEIRVGIMIVTSVGISVIDFVTNQSKPQILTVPDLDEPFLPSAPYSLLPLLSTHLSTITSFLSTLPSLIPSSKSQVTGAALGSALFMCQHLYKGSAGRVVVICSSLPNVGIGAFNDRGLSKSVGLGDKSGKTVGPANNEWFHLGNALSASNVLVDVLAVCQGSHSLDLATLSVVTNTTGGKLIKLHDLSKHLLETRIQCQLTSLSQRECLYSCILRVRTGAHIEVKGILATGSKISSSSELKIPVLSENLTFLVDLSIENKMSEGAIIPLQAAMLFTNSKGERCVRVATISVSISASLPPVFRYSSAEAIACSFVKHASLSLFSKGIVPTREELVTKLVNLLTAYRVYASQRPHLPQLLLPETLQHLPILISSCLRSNLLYTGGDVTLDDRIEIMSLFRQANIFDFVFNLHPFVYDLTEIEDVSYNLAGVPVLPPLLRPSNLVLDSAKICLIVCPKNVYLFVGKDVELDEKFEIDNNVATAIPEWLQKTVNYAIRSKLPYDAPIIYLGDPVNNSGMGKSSITLSEALVEDSLGSNVCLLDFLTDIHRKILENVRT